MNEDTQHVSLHGGGEGVVLLLLVKTRAARLPPASAADLSTQSEMNYARDSATAAGRPILLPFFLSVFFFFFPFGLYLCSRERQKAPCVVSRIRLYCRCGRIVDGHVHPS